jgi:hypothetical protein
MLPVAFTPHPVRAAMLLVLLPLVEGEAARKDRVATLAGLRALQQQLGSAIRVLSVEEASHPAVVRSFQTSTLPACVLLREGLELWRHTGLPVGENVVALLLSKLI